jgi:hypothetical protein
MLILANHFKVEGLSVPEGSAMSVMDQTPPFEALLERTIMRELTSDEFEFRTDVTAEKLMHTVPSITALCARIAFGSLY